MRRFPVSGNGPSNCEPKPETHGEVSEPSTGPARASDRILANTIYLVVADIVSRLLALGFFIIAARHLDVESFGVLSYAIAYVTTLGVLADLGLALYVTREVARRPKDARVLVSNAVLLRLLASLVIASLVALSASTLGLPVPVIVCSILVLTNGLFTVVAGVFQGFERNYYTAVGRAIQTGLLLVGAIVLLRLPPRVDLFTWLYVSASAFSALAAYALMVVRVVRPVLRFDFGAFIKMVRAALPMGISVVLVTAYYWNGSVLLAKFADERAVGVFAAPHRLILGMAVLGMAFSGAMYPHMARLHSEARERLGGVLGRALRYASLTAVPVAILGVALAAEAIGVVYGEAYAESASVLGVLALWGCATYYNSLLSNYYYSTDRAPFATAQAGVSLVVNVTANLLLIPRFGALGAAMALAAAEFAGTIWLASGATRIWDRGERIALVTGVAKCLAAALIAAVLGRGAATINAPTALAAGVAGYLMLLLAFGCVSRTDLLMIRGLLVRKH